MSEFNQAKYIQQFQKEKYDRCIFNIPKGQKAILEVHWKSKGYKSLNSYVNDLIAKDMAGEKSSSHEVNVQGQKNIVMGNNHGNINIQ